MDGEAFRDVEITRLNREGRGSFREHALIETANELFGHRLALLDIDDPSFGIAHFQVHLADLPVVKDADIDQSGTPLAVYGNRGATTFFRPIRRQRGKRRKGQAEHKR